MRMVPREVKQASAYMYRIINTTGNRKGTVLNAWMYKGVVHLFCEDDKGETFYSDTEHATIIK